MKKVISIIIFIVFIIGCKKYPEDIKVPHLGTPERRLIRGNWESVSMLNSKNNGMNYQADHAAVIFDKDNTCISRAPYLATGTWHLTNRKENLTITDDKGITKEYTILQLDHDKLKFKNDSLEYTFTPSRIN